MVKVHGKHGFKSNQLVPLIDECLNEALKRAISSQRRNNLSQTINWSCELLAVYLCNLFNKIQMTERSRVLIVAIVYCLNHRIPNEFGRIIARSTFP